MLEYIRKVIYLREYKEGKKQSIRPGFARIEFRNHKWNLSIIPEDAEMPLPVPVYIVGAGEDGRSAYCVGETQMQNTVCLSLDSRAGQFMRRLKEIYGVLIGVREHYLVGECPDVGETISYEDVENREKEAPVQIQAAEENTEAERRERRTEGRGEGRFQPMYPFEDDEFEWCCQLEPRELGSLPADEWHLAGNSFLMQGYYNYRHLLYARNKKQSYIGVPGQFHRREQYLASRFGFTRFKGTLKKRVTIGDFGYWLREIKTVLPRE